jgi:acyl carrier protein
MSDNQQDKDKIFIKIREVIAEKLFLDPEIIAMESLLFDDLGMNSFCAVEIIYDLETEYGLEISNDEMLLFQKISDIIDFIANRLKK